MKAGVSTSCGDIELTGYLWNTTDPVYLVLDLRIVNRFGVQLAQSTSGLFHFRRTVFSPPLKAKVDSTLAKSESCRVNLNIDGTTITSRTHTHPSHSETSRLLTSSLSLGVPVPRTTQCM